MKVISRSTLDAKPDLEAVLETLLESAIRLCGALRGHVYRYDGEFLRFAAASGAFTGFRDWLQENPVRLDRGSIAGRAELQRKVCHVEDVLADSEYRQQALQHYQSYRSVLCVPLLRNGGLLGVIAIIKSKVEPFTDKQIALVSTFADQAVIAFENVRLFEEVNSRTEDLRKSLQQQTATADVLKVISRSTFDLQTVLDTLVKSATRLCEADHAWLFERDGDLLRFKASFGHGTDVHARLRELFLSRPAHVDKGSVTGRSALEARVVHVPDVLADPDYIRSDAQQIGGYRAALGAPLLRDGTVVGVIFVAKLEPFSEKQIDLVTTFADQAVIAIQNVRLFEDLQARTRDLEESLEQQTATSEVLEVISSSPGELDPVFKTMLANATRICEAEFGVMYRFNDGKFRPAALLNLPPPFAEFVQDRGAFVPLPGSPLGRLLQTGEVTFTHDEAAEPNPGAPARLGGARSLVGVPMRKENELIGAIIIYRQEVRPFTAKQSRACHKFCKSGRHRDRKHPPAWRTARAN